MKRIGLIASKLSQANLISYNIWVFVLSSICAVVLFVVCASAVVTGLFLVSLVWRQATGNPLPGAFSFVVQASLIILAVMIAILQFWAIVKNIRLRKK